MTYYDLSFDFTIDPNKGVIFDQMSSVAISPPLIISPTNLVVGRYRDVNGYCYELQSPSFLTDSRSLSIFRAVNPPSSSKSSCNSVNGHVLTAQIISGPAVEHPGIGHTSIVNDLKDTYVYGIISDSQVTFNPKLNHSWTANTVIGLMQNGNNLIAALFSTSGVPVTMHILDKVLPK